MIKKSLTAMIFILGLSLIQVDAAAREGMTEVQFKAWCAQGCPDKPVCVKILPSQRKCPYQRKSSPYPRRPSSPHQRKSSPYQRRLPSPASSFSLSFLQDSSTDSLESEPLNSPVQIRPSLQTDLLEQHRNENIQLRILIAQLTTKVNKMEIERRETKAAHNVREEYVARIKDLEVHIKRLRFVSTPDNSVFVKMSKKIEDLDKQYKDAMNHARLAVLELTKSNKIWFALMQENTVLKKENEELQYLKAENEELTKMIEGLMELTQNKIEKTMELTDTRIEEVMEYTDNRIAEIREFLENQWNLK